MAWYLPLDPDMPRNRLAGMLRSARPSVVVTVASYRDRLQEFTGSTICLDLEDAGIPRDAGTNVEAPLTPDNLAYVIFTSGSTGEPKGAMVPHGGFGNLSQAQSRAFSMACYSRVLQFASTTFDASLSEVGTVFWTGATLVVPAAIELLPDASFVALLREQRITHVTLPPSILAHLPYGELPDLTCLVVAGEVCRGCDGADGRHRGVSSTRTRVRPRPVSARRWRLPDSHVHRPADGEHAGSISSTPMDVPCPKVSKGTWYIGGIGLARGYAGGGLISRPIASCRIRSAATRAAALRRAAISRDSSPTDGSNSSRRADHQVKLRGFRIEPGEIVWSGGGTPTSKTPWLSCVSAEVVGRSRGLRRRGEWRCHAGQRARRVPAMAPGARDSVRVRLARHAAVDAEWKSRSRGPAGSRA